MLHAVAGAAVAFFAADAAANELVLSAPLDHQVVQRTSPGHGPLTIKGELSEDAPAGATVEVRLVHDGRDVAYATVPHVGVGEVFVVAGQSNSAIHGGERQTPKTGRVATFDGTAWRIANDPQPGGTGGGGSFMPPLGDALVERLGVPVGFIACGVGSSSVRESLPKGATFPNPPTIKSHVERLPDGSWASKGTIYDQFVARMKSAGPQGFRAVLWHKGESDDIRAAQAALWRDGLAIEGPDSDALKGQLRERNGQGVHFSGAGLREHATRWAEKVIPWIEKPGIEKQETGPRPATGDRR